MNDLGERLEKKVKAARTAGDIPALLAIANAAIAELKATADTGASTTDAVALLTAAKRIAYNAAADVWPGWEMDTPARSRQELERARALAETCRGLVTELELPSPQRGNAIWLIGACDLALGRYHAAEIEFCEAMADFAADEEARLMVRGYRAMAAELAEPAVSGKRSDLDAILAELGALGTKDAVGFRQQLQVARSVFSRG
jgi:hypothetical protein